MSYVEASQPYDHTSVVLGEVYGERARQDEKWGEQNHSDGTAANIPWPLFVGDATAAARRAKQRADERAKTGTVTFRDILTEEVAEAYAESDPAKLRAELVQVAAVAVQWIEAIDRRTT